jgi:hypothetical protein
MTYQGLYRKVSITIDIICLIGFPLVLGIIVNYMLAIGVLVFVATVTVLRRRFLDEKTEKLVLGAIPSTRRDGEKTSSLADCRPIRPIRLMALTALLMTCLVAGGVVIAFAVGSPFPWIPVGCLVMVWVGVAIIALSHHFRQRPR